MPFTIEVKDKEVQATLNRLAGAVTNLSPILQALGEDVMERTKQRFSTGVGPDGVRWAPNARATIEAYIKTRGGYGKRGINQKGQALAMNKKPLQGHTGDLARQFAVQVSGNSVTITSGPIYAAIQQFGGKAGRGHKVTIPARPFLPVTTGGDLYPAEQALIQAELQRYLSTAIEG